MQTCHQTHNRFISVSIPSARHLKRGRSDEGSPSSPCVACLVRGPLPPGRAAGCRGYRGALWEWPGRGGVSRAVLDSLVPLQGCPPSHLAPVELCPSLPQGLARPGCFPALADLSGAEPQWPHSCQLGCGPLHPPAHRSAGPALWPLPPFQGALSKGSRALLSLPRHFCGF